MTENESTIILHGIVIAAVVLNIWYVVVIRRYNRKIRQVNLKEKYIAHLEGLITEYENTAKRQNLYLQNGNDTTT